LKISENRLRLSLSKEVGTLSLYQLSLPLKPDKNNSRKIARRTKPLSAKRITKQQKTQLEQSKLPLPRKTSEIEEKLLETRIQAHMKGKLSLTITDNRSHIITVNRVQGIFKVRIHHMFLHADFRILKSLGRYIEKADVKSNIIIESFIDQNSFLIREVPIVKRKEKLLAKGEFHDLQEIYNHLNKKYFGNKIKAKIGWGRAFQGKPKHHQSVKMGTYSLEDKIVKIHLTLDREFVPRYFVESIVFHEMLHQVFGVPIINGRRIYHCPDFLESERRFEHYNLSKRYEKENITRLLFF
jgi:hypothetical protein